MRILCIVQFQFAFMQKALKKLKDLNTLVLHVFFEGLEGGAKNLNFKKPLFFYWLNNGKWKKEDLK